MLWKFTIALLMTVFVVVGVRAWTHGKFINPSGSGDLLTDPSNGDLLTNPANGNLLTRP